MRLGAPGEEAAQDVVQFRAELKSALKDGQHQAVEEGAGTHDQPGVKRLHAGTNCP